MDETLFDSRPGLKNRLNILPDNPDSGSDETAVELGRFPKWLHRKLPPGGSLWKTHGVLQNHSLATVCEEAACPNLLECYSKKTATFLAMGKECTRACGFCDIDFSKAPKELDPTEPERLSLAVKDLGLEHVVITMVARDDLPDGGALHLASIIKALRQNNSTVTIEVLTSDFAGSTAALDTVIESGPEIFNHNIETVRELSPKVRHKATYDRTLSCLHYVKSKSKSIFVKSGLMVGLGETDTQVKETLRDMKNAGCDIVTIGHYLQANRKNLRVKAFITPQQFDSYAEYGRSIGIPYVYSGPFVRSSYNAKSLFSELKSHA